MLYLADKKKLHGLIDIAFSEQLLLLFDKLSNVICPGLIDNKYAGFIVCRGICLFDQ
jgi:hypothetical protein